MNRHFFDLICTKVQMNLKSEASKSYLNYGWWVLEPLLYMSVFYLVFGSFLQRDTPNFVVFLLSGLIPWLWFNKTITNSSMSLIQGRGIMNQIAIRKDFFPLVVLGQDALKQCFAVILLIAFLVIYEIPYSHTWWLLIPLSAVQLAFMTPLALIVAITIPFLPDFRYLVSTGLMLMMFASGIFYSHEDVLLPEHRDLFLLNPMASLIVNYRKILIEGSLPDLSSLAYVIAISMIAFACAAIAYRKLDGTLAKVVME